MHSTHDAVRVDEGADERSAEPLLGLDKNKYEDWHPADGLPEWWGTSDSACGKWCVYKSDEYTTTYVPVLCKQWSCDVCGFYRKAWLVRNVVRAMEEHKLTRFWVLTLQANTRTPEQSHEDVRGAWHKLHDRLVKRYGHFEYVWTVESTKRGIAHLNLLVSVFLPHAEMRAMWREITGDSDNVRFKEMSGTGAARYIAKYVAKEARARRDAGMRARQHHLFGRSRNIHFDAFSESTKGWQLKLQGWKENAEWLRRNCEPLVETMVPSIRIVVGSVRGTPWLKSWGPYRKVSTSAQQVYEMQLE